MSTTAWADVLLDTEHNVKAWTPQQCEIRMRVIASALREAVEEQQLAATEYGKAEADYKRAYHRAHLDSALDEARKGWTVAMHQSHAEIEAEEHATDRIIWKERKASARAAIEGLQTIIEVLRSHNTNARQLAGGRS